MAGLDLSKLFDPDYDPYNLPLASASLIPSNNESTEVIQIFDSQEPENGFSDIVEILSSPECSQEMTSEHAQADLNVCDNTVIQSPSKQPQSTVLLGELWRANLPDPNFSGSTIQTPGPSTPQSRVNVSQTPNFSNTPMNGRRVHPIGWSMPKRRKLDASTTFVLQPLPNYRSTIQRSQDSQIQFRRNYLELQNRDVQALSFVMGTSDNLPQEDLSDNENVGNTEEEEQMANQLKKMLENGDISSWEQIMDQMSFVRSQYGQHDDSSYFHDRNRVLPRLKATYESLNVRPAPTDYEPTPSRMSKELKPHQKNGLKFMLWRETQDPCGGILAGKS